MKNTHLTITLGLIMMTLASASVFAQSSPGWSKPEQLLAEILLRDTSSRTVSYLPKGYWFGLSDRSYGYLKLIKNGAKNYLLRDGTHHVYLLKDEKGKPLLQRLDSSVFYGDNFLSMAFLRKDTIYQYGGYGFWNTRDFFMYYRNTNRDWEFLSGGNGLKNEHNYHFYDEDEDAFYMLGSLYSSHHPVPKKILLDSVYRYDFTTRQWTAVGRFPENFSELNLLYKLELPVCFTPFGFLDTKTSVPKLFDIPGNRILYPTGKFADFVLKLGITDPVEDPDYRIFIYLQDTLHIIKGTEGKINHAQIHLSLKDFDQTRKHSLYIPVQTDASGFSGINQTWIFALSIPLSFAGYYLLNRVRRKRRQEQDAQPSQTEPEYDDNPEDLVPSGDTDPAKNPAQNNDIAFFRSQLNPTEIELLEMLLKATLSGTAADIMSINKTLGVSNKEASLQKTRRSICINNINSCFRQTLKMDENLIIRERDNEDKRAFVYKLDPRYVDLLKV